MKSVFKNTLIVAFMAAIIGLSFEAKGQTVVSKSASMDGVTVANVDISNSGLYSSLAIDVVASEVGGTSDGTIVLQGGNSLSSLSTLTDSDFGGSISWLSNDTLTVVDGAKWLIKIQDPAFRYYRLVATGTSGDTTALSIKYVFREDK